MKLSRFLPVLGLVLLAVGLLGNGTPITSDPEIDVHILHFDSDVATRIVKFKKDELLAMASTSIESMRGTQQKPAIPLTELLFKHVGAKREQVRAVVIMNTGLPAVLRDGDIAHLEKLVLATGKPKGKFGHPWSLAPVDIASWKTLRARVGSRRKHGVWRIDIHLKKEIAAPVDTKSSP